jgi:hypothetical protein
VKKVKHGEFVFEAGFAMFFSEGVIGRRVVGNGFVGI